MKQKMMLMVSLLLAAALLASCAAPAQTSAQTSAPAQTSEQAIEQTNEPAATDAPGMHTVTDHNGNQVSVPQVINRIAVCDIYPLPSVITVFLGSAKKLVGMHPNSMSAAKNGLLGELFPEILDAKTDYIKGTDVNIEELMTLEPDVVFYSSANPQLGEQLTKAGLAAVAVSANNWGYDVLETYNHWIELLGELFPEQAKSTEVSDYSAQTLAMIKERTKGLTDAQKKSVFFIFQYGDGKLVTSGKNFFGQYWAEATGAKNAAEEVELDNNNAVVNMEQVYTWDPDIIFITNFTEAQPDDLYKNTMGTEDWSALSAVKNKQVYKMPLGTYRSYTPGVDTPVTLLWFAKHIYPELFEDVDVEAEVVSYYKKLYGIELTQEQVKEVFDPSADAAASF